MASAPTSPPHKKARQTSDTELASSRPPGSTAPLVSTSATVTSAICNLHSLRNVSTSQPRRVTPCSHHADPRPVPGLNPLPGQIQEVVAAGAVARADAPGLGGQLRLRAVQVQAPQHRCDSVLTLRHNAADHRCLQTCTTRADCTPCHLHLQARCTS